MNKLGLSCAFAAVGIALGAFGAHALKDGLEARDMTEAWRTAVLYHLIHAVALFVVAAAPRQWRCRTTVWLWSLGIVLFSGSLYLLALFPWRFLGPITPIGGGALIAGWVILAIQNRHDRRP